MAKILVTGANGQLGNEMRCLAEEDKKILFCLRIYKIWILPIWKP